MFGGLQPHLNDFLANPQILWILGFSWHSVVGMNLPMQSPQPPDNFDRRLKSAIRLVIQREHDTFLAASERAGIAYTTFLRYVDDNNKSAIPAGKLPRIAWALGMTTAQLVELAESGEFSLPGNCEFGIVNGTGPATRQLSLAFRHLTPVQ